jgi:hypothetical protein
LRGRRRGARRVGRARCGTRKSLAASKQLLFGRVSLRCARAACGPASRRAARSWPSRAARGCALRLFGRALPPNAHVFSAPSEHGQREAPASAALAAEAGRAERIAAPEGMEMRSSSLLAIRGGATRWFASSQLLRVSSRERASHRYPRAATDLPFRYAATTRLNRARYASEHQATIADLALASFRPDAVAPRRAAQPLRPPAVLAARARARLLRTLLLLASTLRRLPFPCFPPPLRWSDRTCAASCRRLPHRRRAPRRRSSVRRMLEPTLSGCVRAALLATTTSH